MSNQNKMLLSIFLFFLLGLSSVANASERVVNRLRIDGMTRYYVAYIPDNIKTMSNPPALFVWHPGFSNAESMERISKFHEYPESQSYVLVYPNGYKRAWNIGYCCGKALEDNIDDLKFYKAILIDLKKRYNIAPQIYTTGYSNGAMMSYHIMCNAPETIAAVATFAASYKVDKQSCPLNKPIPLFHFHGLLDETAPIEGGLEKTLTGKLVQHYKPAEITQTIAQNNDCKNKDSITVLKTNCTHYSKCDKNADVTFCPISDLGHVWPGYAPKRWEQKLFGKGRTDIDGTKEVLEFFDTVRSH